LKTISAVLNTIPGAVEGLGGGESSAVPWPIYSAMLPPGRVLPLDWLDSFSR
jgi:hypothetical protein